MFGTASSNEYGFVHVGQMLMCTSRDDLWLTSVTARAPVESVETSLQQLQTALLGHEREQISRARRQSSTIIDSELPACKAGAFLVLPAAILSALVRTRRRYTHS